MATRGPSGAAKSLGVHADAAFEAEMELQLQQFAGLEDDDERWETEARRLHAELYKDRGYGTKLLTRKEGQTWKDSARGLVINGHLVRVAQEGNAGWLADHAAHAHDINLHEKAYGFNALQWSAIRGHTDCARVLLEQGANVGSFCAGWYHYVDALHLACEQGRRDVVEVLLDHGADVQRASASYEMSDPSGWYPWNVAVKAGHTSVAELLRERGATETPDGKREWRKVPEGERLDE